MLNINVEDCFIVLPQHIVSRPHDGHLVAEHRHLRVIYDVMQCELPRYRSRNEVSGNILLKKLDASDAVINARDTALNFTVELKGERFPVEKRKASMKSGLIC